MKINTEKFGGDKKLPMRTLLAKWEKKFIDALVPKFPRWIQGYHLTLMTILWSVGLIVFGYLAGRNLNWLWLSSLMLVLQWFTDSFDGALGKFRDTGIPKWGYYVDHLLDFVFMCSIFIGYSFVVEGTNKTFVFLLIPVFGCFMASSFLSFGATGEFKIAYLGTGPTEIRLWFIILNCLIIWFGTGWIEKLLCIILIFSVVALCVVVYRTQKYIWDIEMRDKSNHPNDRRQTTHDS